MRFQKTIAELNRNIEIYITRTGRGESIAIKRDIYRRFRGWQVEAK